MEDNPYKTVMLCERPNLAPPTENPSSDSKNDRANGSHQPPFYSLVSKKEPIGFSRPIDVVTGGEIIMSIPKKKDLPYLDRHRRYIQDLNKMHKTVKAEYEQMTAKEDDKKKKNNERWLNRRELRQSRTDEFGTSPNAEQRRSVTPRLDENGPGQSGSPKPEFVPPKTSSSHHSSGPKGAKNGKSKSKPVWAMTESELTKAQEDEADELLAFANNLDFDDFIDSLDRKSDDELRRISDELDKAEQIENDDERIQKVNEIVTKSEPAATHREVAFRTKPSSDVGSVPPSRHEHRTESRDPRTESRSSYRPVLKPVTDLNSSAVQEGTIPEHLNPEVKVVDRILHSSQVMRTIHSAASLRAIIKDKMYRLQQRKDGNADSSLKPIHEEIILPPISAHRYN